MLRVKAVVLSIFLFISFLDAKEDYLSINLTIPGKGFFLNLSYKVPLNDKEIAKCDEYTIARIEISTMSLIGEKSINYLESSKGRKELKKELLTIISNKIKNSNAQKIYFTKFKITPREVKPSQKTVTKYKPKIDKKSEAKKNYKYSYNFLKTTKHINIKSKEYQKALFNAENATKLDPNKSKYWINYAMLLLYLQDVQDAQISAEVAAQIALSLNPKNSDKANMILLQSYINQFDFSNAISLMRDILNKEPILINNLAISESFVSIYAFSGEVEDGIEYLAGLLNKHPTHYGAIIAKIKLHQIELKSAPNTDEITQKINSLEKDLNSIKSILEAS